MALTDLHVTSPISDRAAGSVFAPRVLILDDDITALAMLSGMLRQDGFETSTASTLRAAHVKMATETFDLALLDIKLPDGSGLDICRELHAHVRHGDVPVLIISADSDIQTKVAGFTAEAVDYITKPFHRLEVLARVRTHLRLHDAFKARIELQTLKLKSLADAQHSLIPRPEELPDAHFALHFQPLQGAGGDLCEVVALTPYLHDYIVLDVCGHEVANAMTTAAFHALLRQNCTAIYTPAETLRTVNSVLRSILADGQFVSAVYVRLNRKTNLLTVVGAGHPPAIVQRMDGTVSALWVEGDLVGAFDAPEYGVLETPVQTGDRFFLYSDALIEAGQSGGWKQGVADVIEYLSANRAADIEVGTQSLARWRLARNAGGDDLTIVGVEV